MSTPSRWKTASFGYRYSRRKGRTSAQGAAYGIHGETSPFFRREYVLGLEPCTGWPAGDVPESHDEDGTGTLERLSPGETVETSLEVKTCVDRRGVDAYDDVA